MDGIQAGIIVSGRSLLFFLYKKKKKKNFAIERMCVLKKYCHCQNETFCF